VAISKVRQFLNRRWRRAVLASLLAGPALFCLGIGFAIYKIWFISHAATASGVVTQFIPFEDQEDHSITYRPVFVYSTPDGRIHTVTSNMGANQPEFASGEHVKVLYNPKNPDDASINSFGQLWFLPLGFAGVGFVTFCAGLLFRRLLPGQVSEPSPMSLRSEIVALFR
jgi:hypothetical protein